MPTPNIDEMQMANGMTLNKSTGEFRIIPPQPATAEDIEKDEEGITTPNLHRRLDDDLSVLQPEEVAKDKHSIFMGGTSSYRGIEHFYHDEENNPLEIP